MAKRWEMGFDKLDGAATWIYDAVLWLLARAALVAVTQEEVRKGARAMHKDEEPPHQLRASHARFLYDRQQEASKHTDDKVKVLLTLSAALNTFLLAFAKNVAERWLLVGVAVALTATIFLCVGLLRVRASGAPVPEGAESDPHEYQWARDLYVAAEFDARAQEYRVDLYRAARRWFVVAFALALVAAVRIGGVTPPPGSSPHAPDTFRPVSPAGAHPAPPSPAVQPDPPTPAPRDSGAPRERRAPARPPEAGSVQHGRGHPPAPRADSAGGSPSDTSTRGAQGSKRL